VKIALFYPRNVLASWFTLGGYRLTLERMGHEVLDCPFPGNHPGVQLPGIQFLRNKMPSIEDLNSCDVVISAFHEYTQAWLADVYEGRWKDLKVPVIARFDETMDRTDLGLPARLDELKRWANFYSFPAAQDADKYGGDWLPFGADTTMFKPGLKKLTGIHAFPDTSEEWLKTCAYNEKKYALGFIGSLYPLRQEYLSKLAPFLPDSVTFHHGQVLVQDIGGVLELESTELLAENYRQIKVFFCLPPMSRLLVCKVFEVMACGTFVMYPRMPGGSSKNNVLFKNNEHLVYYDPGYLKQNAKDILHFMEDDADRERIARAGCELVHREFTLEQMLEKLLAPVTAKVGV
jgi:hypothetical protein